MEISYAYNLIMNKLEAWADTAIGMLPNLIVAILILAIFYLKGTVISPLSNLPLPKFFGAKNCG